MILWLLLILSWLVNGLLTVWLIRLRVELWANRRAIAVLGAAGHCAGKASKLRVGESAVYMLALLWIGQLLVILAMGR